jgi:BirA family biotin operon repressor/biotin-[acetyl-CoA-carboxylase] ligase
MIQQIRSVLPEDHLWQNTLFCYDTLPSTNDTAKELARQGAAEGTVVAAAGQTAGKGRLGRSFHAPGAKGVYLSVILRPQCRPEDVMHLTCAVAVAMCNAVEDCCGLRPKIKWTNDLVVGNRKLGGILTELSVSPKTGFVEWAVVGIGINCLQAAGDFPEEIKDIATSLFLQTGNKILPGTLAGYMIRELQKLSCILITEKASILQAYRTDCMTLGQSVVLLRGDRKRYGTALDLDSNGGLIVRFDDGTVQTVESGEISVRGLYGYT